MRTIVAVDPGKYTGLVAVLEVEGNWKLKDSHEATTVDEVVKFINQHNPEILIMESFIANGGRTKDFTALEVIAVVKYVFSKSRMKMVMQSPSCQTNHKADSIPSRHCVSAMKHVLYFLEKEVGNGSRVKA